MLHLSGYYKQHSSQVSNAGQQNQTVKNIGSYACFIFLLFIFLIDFFPLIFSHNIPAEKASNSSSASVICPL